MPTTSQLLWHGTMDMGQHARNPSSFTGVRSVLALGYESASAIPSAGVRDSAASSGLPSGPLTAGLSRSRHLTWNSRSLAWRSAVKCCTGQRPSSGRPMGHRVEDSHISERWSDAAYVTYVGPGEKTQVV
jgi:hypothetical protein